MKAHCILILRVHFSEMMHQDACLSHSNKKNQVVKFIKCLPENDFKIPFALSGLVFCYDHIRRGDGYVIQYEPSESILSMYS